MNEVVCSCEKCRAMCEHSVCLPTPAEARSLVRAGYGEKMRRYEWVDKSGKTVVVVAPAMVGCDRTDKTMGGSCSFYREGLCELHEGMKPLEGRLAHHDRHWLPIRLAVLKHWPGKVGESVAKQLKTNRVP